MLDIVGLIGILSFVIIGVLRSRLNRLRKIARPHGADEPGVLLYLARLFGISLIVLIGCAIIGALIGAASIVGALGWMGTLARAAVVTAREIPAAKEELNDGIVEAARSHVADVEQCVDRVKQCVDHANRQRLRIGEYTDRALGHWKAAHSEFDEHRYDAFWEAVEGARGALGVAQGARDELVWRKTKYERLISETEKEATTGWLGGAAVLSDWSSAGLLANPESTQSEVEQILAEVEQILGRLPAFPQEAAARALGLADQTSAEIELGELGLKELCGRAELNIEFVTVRQRREQLQQQKAHQLAVRAEAERQTELLEKQRAETERQTKLQEKQRAEQKKQTELLEKQRAETERQTKLQEKQRAETERQTKLQEKQRAETERQTKLQEKQRAEQEKQTELLRSRLKDPSSH